MPFPLWVSTQAVYILVDRRPRAAGVGHLGPQDGDESMPLTFYDVGVDVVQILGLLGHASLLTNGDRDRRPELAFDAGTPGDLTG